MTVRQKVVALPIALCIFIPGAGALAQVYRCEQPGTTVFSDVPCAENAEVYDSKTGISVIGAAEGLEYVAERNKAFVDRRQNRLTAMRNLAAERRRRDEQTRLQRAEAALQPRYQTVIGPPAGTRFGGRESGRLDDRIRARQARPSNETSRQREEALQRRRTLLSRSGGNAPGILR